MSSSDDVNTDDTIVDLGCGNGMMLIELVRSLSFSFYDASSYLRTLFMLFEFYDCLGNFIQQLYYYCAHFLCIRHEKDLLTLLVLIILRQL